jgi:uncharacterized protein (TIRG00374 family)
VAVGAGAVLLIVLCAIFGVRELAAALAQASPRTLAVYLMFGLLARLGYSLRWWMVAGALGTQLRLTRLFPARLAGDALGALVPAGRVGGDPLRVALLCGDGTDASRAGAGVALDRVMEVIGNMICAVVYVALFSSAHTFGRGERSAAAIIGLLLGLLAMLVPPLWMLRRGRRPFEFLHRLAARSGSVTWQRWMQAVADVETHLLRFFAQYPAVFVRGLLGSLLIEAIIVAEYHYLLAAFGLALELPTLLMALVAGGLARAVPAPAALGTLEASQVALFAGAAGDAGGGFVVGMVMRLHETVWMLVGFAALSAQGFSLRRLRRLGAPGGVMP